MEVSEALQALLDNELKKRQIWEHALVLLRDGQAKTAQDAFLQALLVYFANLKKEQSND